MKKTLLMITACAALTAPAQEMTPRLEFVLDLNVELNGGMIDVGLVPQGTRTIVPITGGTFCGPDIRGEVLPSGADYQLQSATTQLSQLNAIYSLRTDDGVNIYIQNEGIVAPNNYFFTTPRFQAPVDSKYAWLNESTYVCRPIGFGPGIQLRVWRVCDAASRGKVARAFDGIPKSVYSDVQHQGRVEEMHYNAVMGNDTVTKRAQVYLPYGYDATDTTKKYDVVYLIHGGGDNTTSFFADPRSPLPLTRVLDHLIADGNMEPVIVVAPTFYRDDTNIGANRMDDAIKLTREFHNELHNAVIPAIETRYNTHYQGDIEATREHRAFGGFSMGALTTWYQLAYGNGDVKYYIPLSGDLWIYDSEGQKQDATVAAAWLNSKIASSPFADDFIVYGYTGTDDIAGKPEQALFEALRDHAPLFRINVPQSNASLVIKDGGKHYYGDINEYLYEVLPRLFRD